jgi:beta-phosphoglucomutase-like phosphatase (HAD superfamily)
VTAVIFDLDGVLVDSERHWQGAFADIANEVTRERGWGARTFTAQDMARYAGGRVNETLRDIFTDIGRPEVAADDQLVDALTRRAVRQASEEFLADPKPISSSVDVARSLAREGMKLGVASSSSLDFIDTVLSCLGLAESVAARQSALNLEKGKPDGEVYRRTLRALGERAADCVAVEDSKVGIQAATDAGLRCIGLYTGDPDMRPAHFDNCVVTTSRLTRKDVAAAFEAAAPSSRSSPR